MNTNVSNRKKNTEQKLENLFGYGYFTTHSFLFVWGNDLVKQGNSVHLAADSRYFSSHLAHWPTLSNSLYFKYTRSCSFLYLLTTQSINFCLIPCPMASARKSVKKFPPTQRLVLLRGPNRVNAQLALDIRTDSKQKLRLELLISHYDHQNRGFCPRQIM